MPPNQSKGRGGGGVCPSCLPSGSVAKGHRGRPCAALLTPRPPGGTQSNFIMNKFTRILPILLCTFCVPSLKANGDCAEGDYAIPEQIADDISTVPEPIKFEVLSSRTQRREVTEASELPDLPAVQGTINVTVQVVKDPGLPEPRPPLPALAPDDPAVFARMEELQEAHQGTQLIFLSATVYDHSRTLLRISATGKSEDEITAWSNLDFNHFSGFATFSMNTANGTSQEIGLLMGIGNEEVGEQVEASKLQDLATAGPAFVVSEGGASGEALDILEQLHALYRTEGAQMAKAYFAREKAYAERKAYLLANPQKPKDVVIRFWQRDPSNAK